MSILTLYILIIIISFGLFILCSILNHDIDLLSLALMRLFFLSFAVSFFFMGYLMLQTIIFNFGESNIEDVRIVEGYHIDKIDLIHNYFEFKENENFKRLPLLNKESLLKDSNENTLYSYVTYNYFVSYKLGFLTHKQTITKSMIINREDINSFNE